MSRLTGSKAEDVDVVMTVDEVDVEKQRQALDCSVTYRGMIGRAGAGVGGDTKGMLLETPWANDEAETDVSPQVSSMS